MPAPGSKLRSSPGLLGTAPPLPHGRPRPPGPQHPLPGLCRDRISRCSTLAGRPFSPRPRAVPTGTLPASPRPVPPSSPRARVMPLASQSLENVCFAACFATVLALQNHRHLSLCIINSPPISKSIESTFSPLPVVPKLYTQLISKYQFRNLAR